MTKTVRFQVYDRTLFKYYTSVGQDQFGWTFFKREGIAFSTRKEAEDIIAFLKVFKAHEYVVIPLVHRKKSPVQELVA